LHHQRRIEGPKILNCGSEQATPCMTPPRAPAVPRSYSQILSSQIFITMSSPLLHCRPLSAVMIASQLEVRILGVCVCMCLYKVHTSSRAVERTITAVRRIGDTGGLWAGCVIWPEPVVLEPSAAASLLYRELRWWQMVAPAPAGPSPHAWSTSQPEITRESPPLSNTVFFSSF